MMLLIAGGSLSAGSHDPHFGTSMPLGAGHPIWPRTQTTCVGPTLKSHLICVRERLKLRVGSSTIARRYKYVANVSAVAILSLAHRRYNTVLLERGAAYAASVEQVLARVRTIEAVPADDVRAPEPPRPPSGLGDALHPGSPVDDADDGMSDALHHANPKDEPK